MFACPSRQRDVRSLAARLTRVAAEAAAARLRLAAGSEADVTADREWRQGVLEDDESEDEEDAAGVLNCLHECREALVNIVDNIDALAEDVRRTHGSKEGMVEPMETEDLQAGSGGGDDLTTDGCGGAGGGERSRSAGGRSAPSGDQDRRRSSSRKLDHPFFRWASPVPDQSTCLLFQGASAASASVSASASPSPSPSNSPSPVLSPRSASSSSSTSSPSDAAGDSAGSDGQRTSDVNSDSVSGSASGSASGSGSSSSSGTDTDTDSIAGTDADAVTDADANADTDTDSDSDADADAEARADTDTDTNSDAEAFTDAGGDAAVEAEGKKSVFSRSYSDIDADNEDESKGYSGTEDIPDYEMEEEEPVKMYRHRAQSTVLGRPHASAPVVLDKRSGEREASSAEKGEVREPMSSPSLWESGGAEEGEPVEDEEEEDVAEDDYDVPERVRVLRASDGQVVVRLSEHASIRRLVISTAHLVGGDAPELPAATSKQDVGADIALRTSSRAMELRLPVACMHAPLAACSYVRVRLADAHTLALALEADEQPPPPSPPPLSIADVETGRAVVVCYCLRAYVPQPVLQFAEIQNVATEYGFVPRRRTFLPRKTPWDVEDGDWTDVEEEEEEFLQQEGEGKEGKPPCVATPSVPAASLPALTNCSRERHWFGSVGGAVSAAAVEGAAGSWRGGEGDEALSLRTRLGERLPSARTSSLAVMVSASVADTATLRSDDSLADVPSLVDEAAAAALAVNGNSTGSVTGPVTGSVTGPVTGPVTEPVTEPVTRPTTGRGTGTEVSELCLEIVTYGDFSQPFSPEGSDEEGTNPPPSPSQRCASAYCASRCARDVDALVAAFQVDAAAVCPKGLGGALEDFPAKGVVGVEATQGVEPGSLGGMVGAVATAASTVAHWVTWALAKP